MRSAPARVVATAALAWGGCTSQAPPAPAASTSTTAAAPTGTRPGVEPALVVPEAPPGFAAIVERSQAFDLDTYAAELSVASADDRLVLEAAGFREGVVRSWFGERDQAIVALYAFRLADQAGAEAVQAHFVTDGATVLRTTPFALDDPPGAVGASYDGGRPGAPTRVHAVYLVRGAVLYNVVASHTDTAAGPGVAVDFARRVAAAAGP